MFGRTLGLITLIAGLATFILFWCSWSSEDVRTVELVGGSATTIATPADLVTPHPEGARVQEIVRKTESSTSVSLLKRLLQDRREPQTEGPLYVRFVDSQSDLPIGAVQVAVGSRRKLGIQSISGLVPWRTPVATTESDPAGFATLARAGRKATTGVAWRDGYGPIVFPTSVASTMSAEPTTLRMSESGSIEVEVVEAAGGPAIGLTVMLEAWGHSFARPEGTHLNLQLFQWTEVTDEEGRARIAGLPPVGFGLRLISSAGAAVDFPEPVVLEPGESRRVEWTLGGGSSVRGTLTRPGAGAIPQHPIWLMSAFLNCDQYLIPTDPTSSFRPDRVVLTDATGRFSFDDVPPGSWWVAPGPKRNPPSSSNTMACLARFVQTNHASGDVEVDLVGHSELTIAGRVVLEDEPHIHITATMVTASPLDGPGGVRTTCSDDGTFLIGPLPPGGYEVTANAWGGSRSVPASVTAEAGEEGLELRLHLGSSLVVRIVDDATGDPAPAEVSIIGHKPLSYRSRSYLDEKSTWHFSSLEGGRYTILAQTRGGLAGLVRGIEVPSGGSSEQATVRVVRGSLLRVRWTGKGAVDYTVFVNDLAVAWALLRPGQDGTEPLPAGSYRIVVKAVDRAESYARNVDLGPREELLLTFPGDQ